MHIIGLIAEYNPFHLGHLYQINKIKEMYPNSIIIVITNNSFTQRGDIFSLNKWDKTEIALNNNIDIVVELPFCFASQSADIFAKGALAILNELKIDTLVFGSESNNVERLKELANIQINNKKYDDYVQEYLDKGINYPTAMSNALEKICKYKIEKPNDLLGLSYIKEIIKNNYNITPISIERTNDYHSNNINSNIINASLIRKMYNNNENIDNYLPNNISKYMYKKTISDFYPYLKYQILTNKNNLSKYQTVDEGIENRIIKYIDSSCSWEDLVRNIKTRRYTYNKVNRMLIHILTSFTKEEATNLEIDYIRLLGFNKKGKDYLNSVKKNINIPIITNYKKNISKILDIEFRITDIYNLIINDNLKELEYKHKPIIKM